VFILTDQADITDYNPDDDGRPSFNQQQQTEFIVGFIAKAPYRACKPPKQLDRNGICREVWNHTTNTSLLTNKQLTATKPAVVDVLLLITDENSPSLYSS
jgi:hypothetical protein